MQAHQDFDFIEAGRSLGHDLCRHSRFAADDDWALPVLEGFAQARAARVARQVGDRYSRKWLQLRLSAHRRGRHFDPQVTPALLRVIDVEECPVTRVALTHGEQTDTDWSVDRLNNLGAYAKNNLAVMSTRANRAKSDRSFDEVLVLSARPNPSDGLTPLEWLRLAALMLGPCFATRPQEAPVMALAAPIPRYSVREATQQVQHVFTTWAVRPSGKNLLIKHLKEVSPNERATLRLCRFAEAVHLGLKGTDHCHDVWLKPGVMQALLAWRESLDRDAWAAAAEVSRKLSGAQLVPAARLASWHIASRGYVQVPGRSA